MLRLLAVLFLAAATAVAACGTDSTTASVDGGASDAETDVAAAADTQSDAGVDAGGDVATGVCAPTPTRCDALDGAESPTRLSEHAAAYDDEGLRMVVFGGTTGVPRECNPAVASAYVADTWLYDDVCDVWTRSNATGPSARGRHVMASGAGSAWVFGGRWREDDATAGSYTLFDELWRYDLAADTWTLVEPTGVAPSARVNSVMVWDDLGERLLLTGGSSTSGAIVTPLDDVWAFDPAASTWSELSPAGAPAPRLGAAGTFDSTRNRLIVFGGFDSFDFGGGVEYFSDIWALDLDTDTWIQLQNAASAPQGRFGASMVHDTALDVYVTFGGHDDAQLGNRNDAWIFVPSADVWGRLSDGDVFNSPQLDVCDFPPDFTTIQAEMPERRSYGSFVWSETCGHGLLFGGKTDCGSVNDVWEYADETWEEDFSATAGEVCVRFRPNPDNCANLCF